MGFHQKIGSSPEQGMTLIEIIIVVSLMAGVYAMAAPDLMLSRDAEMRVKLNKVMEDVRSAYDLSVLTGRYHRMVFIFDSGEYWLEETDSKDFKFGGGNGDRDLTVDEEQAAFEEFEASFEEFEELAGEEVQDPKDDSMIKPTSPLIKAKGQLMPTEWRQIKTGEWDLRQIGPDMVFMEIQAEHHSQPQSLESGGEGARAILYFFPQGYVERSIIKIADAGDDGNIDLERRPTVIITESLEGTARTVNDDFDLEEYIEATGS